MAMSFVKKKYTTVIPLRVAAGNASVEFTISHIGGRNITTPGSTQVITDANPDGMLIADMALYQFFKISGVAFKLFFPEGTEAETTPVQWAMGYSSNIVINPVVPFGRLQALQTYQTSSCSAKVPVSRFFRTGLVLKRLGIDWARTANILDWDNNAPTIATTLYGGQLPGNSGSSTNIKIYRSNAASTTAQEIGRVQITWYVLYKGSKGVNALA